MDAPQLFDVTIWLIQPQDCMESELGISKQAKLSRLSLLACNFWHLKLACLACLAKIVGLLGLLARLIDFCIEVLGLYTKLRLWPTPKSLLLGPTRSYNAQLRRGSYHEAWQGVEGGFERGFKRCTTHYSTTCQLSSCVIDKNLANQEVGMSYR